MRYLVLILLISVLSNFSFSQEDGDFIKGTKPKSIIVNSRTTKTHQPENYGWQYHYYYNDNEKLDSTIITVDNMLRRKKLYFYDDTLKRIIDFSYSEGQLISHKISYENKFGFIHKAIERKNISSQYELFIKTENIKNEINNKIFTIIRTKNIVKNRNSVEVLEYLYHQDSIVNKVISYNNNNPKEDANNVTLNIENRELFVPKVIWNLDVEFRSDSTFIKHYKNGEVYITEKCFEEKDYKFCESDYKPIGEDYRLIEGEIISKDTTINYTVEFNYVDSIFVKDNISYSSRYKNGYHSYKYDYGTKEYLRKESGFYTFLYDEKKNWVERKLEKDNGEIEITTREIKY